eukprot:gene13460-14847_t
MKVSLAVQALSSSVADAIDFLRDGLGVDRFKSSESTVQFIRQIDRLFAFLNSRNPAAKALRKMLLCNKITASNNANCHLVKDILCENCKECLIGTVIKSDHGYSCGYNEVSGPAAFTAFVNNGELAIPSESIFKIIQCCEELFREHVCKEKYAEITKMKNIRKRMILSVVSHSWGERRQLPLFENHPPGLNEILFEEEYERWLTKCVADRYFLLRLYTYGKDYCQWVILEGKASRRHKLMKLVHFKNQ